MTNNNLFHNNKGTFRSVLVLMGIIIITFVLGMNFQAKDNQLKGLSVKLAQAKEEVKIVEVERPLKEENYIDVVTYIAKRFEGHGKKAVAEAIAISYLESKWTATATNQNTNGTTDRGYWQINSGAHPQITEECARNLECSTNYALKLYEKQGFRPWVASKVTKYFW